MKRRAFTLVEFIAIFIAIAILLSFLFVTFAHITADHEAPKEVSCASNLKQIYTCMVLYSADYNGVFPLINLQQGKIVGEDIIVHNRVQQGVDNAFKDIPATEGRSVSQNLWLLVRGELAQPELFKCPSSEQAGQKCNMKDVKDNSGGVGSEYFVDFPYEKPHMTISYSFIQPWSVFGEGKDAKKWFWSTNIDPRLVIGADANDNKQPNYPARSLPPETNILKDYINSTNHKDFDFRQNVLYGDGHVTFEKSAYVGINKDNIFTAQPKDYKGEAGQTPGVLSVRPANETDSVLVPNREEDLKNWDRLP